MLSLSKTLVQVTSKSSYFKEPAFMKLQNGIRSSLFVCLFILGRKQVYWIAYKGQWLNCKEWSPQPGFSLLKTLRHWVRYPTPAFQCWLHINCPNSWSSLLRARVSVSQRWPPFNYRNPRQHVTLIRGICGWICCGANLFWGSSFLTFPFFLFLILCLFEDLLIDFVCVLGFLHVHMCTMCVQ